MPARLIFSITALIAFVGGIGLLLLPEALLTPMGVKLNPPVIHLARLSGACSIGLAVVLWSARNLSDWHSLRAIALGAFVANTLALIVAIISTVTGVMNVLGWVNVVVDTLITVGFGYLLLVRKAA